MRAALLSLPGKIQFLVVVCVTVIMAFTVAYICSRFFDANQLKANTDLTSAVYQVMGTIYAIFLTFTLWGVWQNYTDADAAVQKEAYTLLDLVHIAEFSQKWAKYNIREQALAYSNWVVKQEWPALKFVTSETINVNETTHSASNKLTMAVQQIVPEGDRELAVFAQTLSLLNSWLDARRTRILIARGNSAKALWPLLITGAFVLFSFHGLFVAQSHAIWITLLTGVSLVIGLAFFLIFSLDCPFSGAPSIDSEPFRLAVHLLNGGHKSA